MRLDFWNNPIVVSAFRVKNRREFFGGVFNSTAIYILILVAGGAILARYNDKIGGSWSRNYLLGLLTIQFIFSSLIAITSTSTSLRSEVNNRTLDYQRIATLSPRQILLGKLVGEPTFAWMLSMATVPLAVWCWILGVTGVSLSVLVLIYANLVTTIIVFGSLGLLQRVDTPAVRPAGVSRLTVLVALVPLAFVPPLIAAGAGPVQMPPWAEAMVGLPTPIGVFFGIAQGNPWRFCLSFYGLRIPLLLMTPLAQLAVAFLCFKTMERRLINPLNTSFRKGTAYLVLLVVDVLAGGVLLEPVPLGLPFSQRVAAFAVTHLAAGFLLLTLVTPWRESLESRVWRLRGRLPRFRDLWLGERSENRLALVTFCLIGVIGLVAGVVVPYGRQDGFAEVRDQQAILVSVLAILVLLTLSLGTLYQWLGAVAGRTGMGLFVTLALILIIPCHVVGYNYQVEGVLALAPSAHFAAWFNGTRPPSLVPLFALYGLIGILAWVALRRRTVRLRKIVNHKLEVMGVVGAG
jgi:hypothetical protein